MADLPVIPRPPKQWWRAFRIQLVPPLIFVCTVAGIVVSWNKSVVLPALIETRNISTTTNALAHHAPKSSTETGVAAVGVAH